MQAFPCRVSRWVTTQIFPLIVGVFVFQMVMVHGAVSQAQEIERVSGRKTIEKISPAYPEIAKTLKLSGKVKIIARVSPGGKVVATEIVGGHPILARAAVDAVVQWRYEAGPQQTNEIAVITFQP